MTTKDFANMNVFRFPAIALLLLSAIAVPANAALPDQVSGQTLPSLAPLVAEVSPAVVNIAVSATVETQSRSRDPFRDFFGLPGAPSERSMRSAGSGVIVDAENGYILTNHHVVANADDIEITLFDERTFKATVVGSDEGTDVAVLKVEEKNLAEIPLGDSDNMRVGDFVIAIGNPFGLESTVTSGIISALGRSGINRDGYEDFIQTDASINPGNSGGALVNLSGELIGINSAIISGSGGNVGIGFAVPSNMARSIMRQLLEYGDVRRGLLGVSIDTINASNAAALGLKNVRGAIVQSVAPNSAAEEAGIEVNDIVTAVDGRKIDSASELRNSIGLMRSGDEVEITLLRDGRTRRVKATLADLNASMIADAGSIHPGFDGARFDSAQNVVAGEDGVVVTGVEPGSAAAARGLRTGDRIVAVNRQRVEDIEAFREAIERVQGGIVFIEIERNGRGLLLQIR
jgi:serine protease Do/serine protease DegQ